MRRIPPVHPVFHGVANAAGAALALCQSRWEEVTLALYLDSQCRLVGHTVVATGQLSSQHARSFKDPWRAKQAPASSSVTGPRSPQRLGSRGSVLSGTLAAACSRYGLSLVDHLVVVATGEYTSAFLGGP
jgi:hypothetical protein